MTCEACDDDVSPVCDGCACCGQCCRCTETDCDCDECLERRVFDDACDCGECSAGKGELP